MHCRRRIPFPTLFPFRLLILILLAFTGISQEAKAQKVSGANKTALQQDPSIIAILKFAPRPDRAILFPAFLGEKQVMAELNTGTARVVFPKRLGVKVSGRAKQITIKDCFDIPVEAEAVTLPLIRIGNFEVKNIPAIQTLAEESAERQKKLQGSSFFDRVLLSNDVFKDVIVTIDYKQSTVTIKKPDLNASNRKLAYSDKVIPFFYRSDTSGDEYEWPVIHCTIDNTPIAARIDTGWGGDEFLLWKNGREKLSRTNYKIERRSMARSGSLTGEEAGVDIIGDVLIRLGIESQGDSIARSHDYFIKKAICSPAVSREEAVLGYSVLKDYRVTFDYPHKQLMLEWNPLTPFYQVLINGSTVTVGPDVTIKVTEESQVTYDGKTITVPAGGGFVISQDGKLSLVQPEPSKTSKDPLSMGKNPLVSERALASTGKGER